MTEHNRKGAIGALLDEYAKAIIELQSVISDVAPTQLAAIADDETPNPDCRSIQTVLTHVISSGFSYAVYIRHSKQIEGERPEKILRPTAQAYMNALDEVFRYTVETFRIINDNELEEFDDSKKIDTRWGQRYDIEQMMEHAIVHILRHRRQIERFKKEI